MTSQTKTTFWIPLLVPFIFIAVILIKIYFTLDLGIKANLINKKIYTYDDFMSEEFLNLKDENTIAIEKVKLETKITSIIEQRRSKFDNNPNYGWISFVKKENNNRYITFKENGINPFLVCKCNFSENKKLRCDLIQKK